MAITVAMRTEVSQLYVALFGRAPDSEGLGFWVTQRNSGQSVAQVADAMYATAPARAYFPSFLTNQEIISSFYQNVLGRAADAEGLAFWTGKLNAAGATPGSVIAEMISAVANYDGSDPAGLTSAALFNNKAEVAQYYAEHGGDIGSSTLVLAGVTADPATADAAIAAIDSGAIGGVDGDASLTTALDMISGSSGNDTFMARVVQNQNGEQTNQLATGDQINGGAGDDTLLAKAIPASALNEGAYMAITPETVDVENVLVTALTTFSYYEGEDSDNGQQVVLNAKDMLGLDLIGSVQSDASLTISNLTTLTDSGVYADRRNTDEVTIRMDHTGNGDATEAESDLTVLFDQDYLLAGVSNDSRAFYWLLDEQAELAGNSNRLQRIDVDGIRFTIGDDPTIITLSDRASWQADSMITHAGFVAALQNELAALIADGTVPAGATLTVDTSRTDNTGLDDGSISDPIPAIVLTLTDGQTVVPVGFSRVEDAVGAYDVYGTFTNQFTTEDLPITATIELEKVGRGSDGGHLIVGGMSTDGENVWDSGSGSKGIERFNITVFGDETQPSSLESLASTNNTLEIVNVVSAAGSVADLTIGNSQTPGGLGEMLRDPIWQTVGHVITPTSDNVAALKDVQTFDASGFVGDLTLFAGLTDEVVPKYMNLMDEAPDAPAADNVQFFYTGGSGNDYINMWIDNGNMAAAGTTTREDFVLNINGGAGDDEIITMIGDGYAGLGEDLVTDDNLTDSFWNNWYQNSAINANLSIDGNDGNDTVRTLGSGNWIIDGGIGNDTIYADNTGGEDTPFGEDSDNIFNDGKATWVLNSVNNNVDDLLSENAASVSAVNAQLTVHFMGYSKLVTIADSVGKTANVTITDLHINQAIKLAINGDPVLSKLLVAEDGPGRTLVVRSLIDGHMDDGEADYNAAAPIDNLSIRFSTATFTAQQSGIVPALASFTTAAAAVAGNALLDGYNPTGDAEFGHDDIGPWAILTGEDSINVADNEIEGGLGNDVIVLATGEYSNDTLVYNGFDNGTDSIVNFEDSVEAGWNNQFPPEMVVLAFTASDGNPAAQTIVFDGVTVNLAAPTLQGIIPSLDVASQFVNQYNAAAATNNWLATLGPPVPVAGTATAEVATMTATDLDADMAAGETYTVAGLTYTSTAATTQAQLAAAFANLADGSAGNVVATGTFSGALTGYSTGAVTAIAGGQTVAFTSSTTGPVADLTDSGTGAAAAAIAVTSQGTADVLGWGVILTRDVPGAVTDLTAAAFTGSYFASAPDPDGQGVVAVTTVVQGQDNVVAAATNSTFTVTYDTATTAVTAAGDAAITNPVSAVTGDGAFTLALKLATAGVAGYTAGSVVPALDGSSYSVTFTAVASGVTAIPADTTFGLGATAADGVNGTFTSTVGTVAVTAPPVFVVGPDTDFDFIDFSSYDATGVVVTDTSGTATIIGTANAASTKWITMVETTNDGEYVISLVTSGAAAGPGDDVAQVIGTADFGFEKDFTVDTFII